MRTKVAEGLRRMVGLWCVGLVLGLSACASGPRSHASDPFEPMNRRVMEFNDAVDGAVLKPAATAYQAVTPAMVRTGVNNFFGNLGDLWSGANHLLQGRVQTAAEHWMRVNINTLFGLGGVLDIASEMNLERQRADFGQTLGRWGVPSGPYLVLPLLGPSTVRDATTLTLESRVDGVRLVNPAEAESAAVVLRLLETRANLLRASTVLDEAALDRYTFTRDVFLQRRQGQIQAEE